jgi:hypothetical protein
MERFHRSSCLKTSGRSRFFVPSSLPKVVVCNDHFETETMNRLNEFVPTYGFRPYKNDCFIRFLNVVLLFFFRAQLDLKK